MLGAWHSSDMRMVEMVTWLPRIPRLERRHGTVGTRPRHRRSSFQIPARESITSHIASINMISSSVPQFRHGCTSIYLHNIWRRCLLMSSRTYQLFLGVRRCLLWILCVYNVHPCQNWNAIVSRRPRYMMYWYIQCIQCSSSSLTLKALSRHRD